MDDNLVESLEKGIYRGICEGCPWYGSVVDDQVCARTAVNKLIDLEVIMGESLPLANFIGAKSDLSDRADNCARVLIGIALRDQTQPLEPTEILNIKDLAELLMNNSTNK
jgi:hypothetical protein